MNHVVLFIKKGTEFRDKVPVRGHRLGEAIVFDKSKDIITSLFVEGNLKTITITGADRWSVIWYESRGREATFLQQELDLKGYREYSHSKHLVDPSVVTTTGIDWRWVSHVIYNTPTNPINLTAPAELKKSHAVQFLSWSTFYAIIRHKWCKTKSLFYSEKRQHCLTAWCAMLLLDAIAGVLLVGVIQTLVVEDSSELFRFTSFMERNDSDNTSLQGVVSISDKLREVVLIIDNNTIDYTEWLLGWPAGFKGNTELNSFLGSKVLLRILRLQVPDSVNLLLSGICCDVGMVMILLISGVLGLSGIVGLFTDLLSVLFFKYIIVYILFGILYSTVKGVVVELSRQMTGKKFNPLKNIIDSHSFDAHQKLVSIIAFALCSFLFPTICVYFIFMLSCYGSLRLLQEVILVSVVVLFSLPIFAVPFHLLSPVSSDSFVLKFLHAQPGGSVFLMNGTPIPFSQLFSEPVSILSHWIKDGPLPSLKKALGGGSIIPVTTWF